MGEFWNRPKSSVEDNGLTDCGSGGRVLWPRTLELQMNNRCASLQPNIFELRRNPWWGGEVAGPKCYPTSQPSFLCVSLAAITSPLPLTAATTASPPIFPDGTLHKCRLHNALGILNVNELIRIPRSHVTSRGWPVWLAPDPRSIRTIFTDM